MKREEYTIGTFSVITHIPVKTLRYYHETGVLHPSRIDEETGYRYYDEGAIDRARVVQTLRRLEFSHSEIVSLIAECGEDEDALDFLRRKAVEIHEKAKHYRRIEGELDRIIATIESQNRQEQSMNVIQKTVPEFDVISLRYSGRYDEIGPKIATLYRIASRLAKGPVFALYWDGEYREEGADIEVCLPLRAGVLEKARVALERYSRTPNDKHTLSVRTLPSASLVTTVHSGPYETLGTSYKRVLDAIRLQEGEMGIPIREIYLKGPGMIFRGNSDKYRTEIQIPTQMEYGTGKQ